MFSLLNYLTINSTKPLQINLLLLEHIHALYDTVTSALSGIQVI